MERALNLLTEMKQMLLLPTHVTYNAVIHAAGRSMRRHDVAHELFDEMRANGYKPDTYTYSAVLLACSHEGEVAKAKELMYARARVCVCGAAVRNEEHVCFDGLCACVVCVTGTKCTATA